jgi:hypothetical protein
MQKTEIRFWPTVGGLVAIDADEKNGGLVLKVGGSDDSYEVLLTSAEARDVARDLDSLAKTQQMPPWGRQGGYDGEEE